MDTRIKTNRTAAKVASVLAVVESVLVTDGRPRKLPGKPRAHALGLWGNQINRINKKTMWDADKFSLAAAFQLGRIQAGASKTQMLLAMHRFVDAYYGGPIWDHADPDEIIEHVKEIDNHQLDTRRLARDARHARKNIEGAYNIEPILRREVNA